MVRMPCGHLVRVSETGQQLTPGKCVSVANFLLLNPELYNYTVKSHQCTILNMQRNWQKILSVGTNPTLWQHWYYIVAEIKQSIMP